MAISPAAPLPGASLATAAAVARASASRPQRKGEQGVGPWEGRWPGLWVSSANSCASDAALAAVSRPAGPSTKALRKASAAASLGNALLPRARSIQSVVSRSTEASSHRSAAEMEASSVPVFGALRRNPPHPREMPGPRGAVSAPPPRSRHPCGVALEQQIGRRVRRVTRGWQISRRLRDLVQERGAGRPPGEDRGLQGGEQRVPRGARVQRPQSPCRANKGEDGPSYLPAVELIERVGGANLAGRPLPDPSHAVAPRL
jgi:hypothetical protein